MLFSIIFFIFSIEEFALKFNITHLAASSTTPRGTAENNQHDPDSDLAISDRRTLRARVLPPQYGFNEIDWWVNQSAILRHRYKAYQERTKMKNQVPEDNLDISTNKVCPSQGFFTISDVLFANRMDLLDRCNNCKPCHFVKRIICVAFMFQVRVARSIFERSNEYDDTHGHIDTSDDSDSSSPVYYPPPPREENDSNFAQHRNLHMLFTGPNGNYLEDFTTKPFYIEIVKKSQFLIETKWNWVATRNKLAISAAIVRRETHMKVTELSLVKHRNILGQLANYMYKFFKDKNMDRITRLAQSLYFSNSSEEITISDIISRELSAYETYVHLRNGECLTYPALLRMRMKHLDPDVLLSYSMTFHPIISQATSSEPSNSQLLTTEPLTAEPTTSQPSTSYSTKPSHRNEVNLEAVDNVETDVKPKMEQNNTQSPQIETIEIADDESSSVEIAISHFVAEEEKINYNILSNNPFQDQPLTLSNIEAGASSPYEPLVENAIPASISAEEINKVNMGIDSSGQPNNQKITNESSYNLANLKKTKQKTSVSLLPKKTTNTSMTTSVETRQMRISPMYRVNESRRPIFQKIAMASEENSRAAMIFRDLKEIGASLISTKRISDRDTHVETTNVSCHTTSSSTNAFPFETKSEITGDYDNSFHTPTTSKTYQKSNCDEEAPQGIIEISEQQSFRDLNSNRKSNSNDATSKPADPNININSDKFPGTAKQLSKINKMPSNKNDSGDISTIPTEQQFFRGLNLYQISTSSDAVIESANIQNNDNHNNILQATTSGAGQSLNSNESNSERSSNNDCGSTRLSKEHHLLIFRGQDASQGSSSHNTADKSANRKIDNNNDNFFGTENSDTYQVLTSKVKIISEQTIRGPNSGPESTLIDPTGELTNQRKINLLSTTGERSNSDEDKSGRITRITREQQPFRGPNPAGGSNSNEAACRGRRGGITGIINDQQFFREPNTSQRTHSNDSAGKPTNRKTNSYLNNVHGTAKSDTFGGTNVNKAYSVEINTERLFRDLNAVRKAHSDDEQKKQNIISNDGTTSKTLDSNKTDSEGITNFISEQQSFCGSNNCQKPQSNNAVVVEPTHKKIVSDGKTVEKISNSTTNDTANRKDKSDIDNFLGTTMNVTYQTLNSNEDDFRRMTEVVNEKQPFCDLNTHQISHSNDDNVPTTLSGETCQSLNTNESGSEIFLGTEKQPLYELNTPQRSNSNVAAGILKDQEIYNINNSNFHETTTSRGKSNSYNVISQITNNDSGEKLIDSAVDGSPMLDTHEKPNVVFFRDVTKNASEREIDAQQTNAVDPQPSCSKDPDQPTRIKKSTSTSNQMTKDKSAKLVEAPVFYPTKEEFQVTQ